jgi:hypothetical protein
MSVSGPILSAARTDAASRRRLGSAAAVLTPAAGLTPRRRPHWAATKQSASETAPTRTRLPAHAVSRLNQLRETAFSPR